MKHTVTFFITCLTIFSIFTLPGCKEDIKPVSVGSTGKTNEIVLVVNNHIGLKNPVIDTVKEYFTDYDMTLPQAEPLYSMFAVTEKELNSQITIQRHHNLLLVNIDPSLEKSTVSVRKDAWSTPQQVIQFNANSDTAFYRIFNINKKAVMKFFDNNELLRAQNLTEFGKNLSLSDDIYKQFDLLMNIPAGFYPSVKHDDFIWFSQRTAKKDQDMIASIMIWQRPYTDELQFSTDSLIDSRNRISRKYIAGSMPGSYMKTATGYIYPSTEVIADYATDFAVEMRGLWEMQGDFMGGPFISYTFAHPDTGQLITIEAFLYNPNNPKRALMRQLESIIRNVKFPEKKNTSSDIS